MHGTEAGTYDDGCIDCNPPNRSGCMLQRLKHGVQAFTATSATAKLIQKRADIEHQ